MKNTVAYMGIEHHKDCPFLKQCQDKLTVELAEAIGAMVNGNRKCKCNEPHHTPHKASTEEDRERDRGGAEEAV